MEKTKKTAYQMIPFVLPQGKMKTRVTDKRSVGAKIWGWKKGYILKHNAKTLGRDECTAQNLA